MKAKLELEMHCEDDIAALSFMVAVDKATIVWALIATSIVIVCLASHHMLVYY